MTEMPELLPYTYGYQYHDCIRFNGGREVNGARPISTIAVYSQEQVDGLLAEIERLRALIRAPSTVGVEYCPTCHRTDEGSRLEMLDCRDPWHSDDHLRAKASPTLVSEKEGEKGAPDYEAAGIGKVLRQAKSEANEKLYGKSSHAKGEGK